MKFRSLLGLVLCNVIWAANPVMGKLVMTRFAPAHAAWLRYASALFAYGLLLVVLRFLPKWSARFGLKFVRHASWSSWGLLAGLGFLAFCYAPMLQLSGLCASRATDGALLTAMEPLFAVFLACVFLRERLQFRHVVSFSLSLFGVVLLSGMSADRSISGWDGHLLANVAILVSMIGEGAYSVIGRVLVAIFSPIAVFGTSLLIGVALLTGVSFLYAGVPDLSAMTPSVLLAVLWLGPLGTTASYLYWLVVLRDTSVAGVVLTLFIQPIVGACFGYAFLGERLSMTQLLGAVTILLGVFVQFVGAVSRVKNKQCVVK